ncbi:hypothetical protein NS228_17105 [Methylobacterium indicum]|uniref:DUF29 domain-containing protein n=1 Tax=Methylobacterium indicum TaxID=1775910 RepID=UPI000733EA55|nr:DUF29 domain-containing protein [Methylobacterium indicum]KTS37383.1 hypothetical protein NS229_07485 [Methylobacterium indicum]KTS38582.1 hypothetical protein NS228_17105 [Methylobacterium indicum]KTS54390.1 hypothetical protein NS230_01565 [Methylobacterium indicum]
MDEIRTDRPSLYDEDVVAWAEQQAAALRALGARPDLSNTLDWDNIIEEVESVGRSEVSTVESALRLVLVHLIKHLSAPHLPPSYHWRSEIVAFQITGRSSYRASMRRKIDLDKVWRDAVVQAEANLTAYHDAVVAGLPETSPFTLDDLVTETFDLDRSLIQLAASLDSTRATRRRR